MQSDCRQKQGRYRGAYCRRLGTQGQLPPPLSHNQLRCLWTRKTSLCQPFGSRMHTFPRETGASLGLVSRADTLCSFEPVQLRHFCVRTLADGSAIHDNAFTCPVGARARLTCVNVCDACASTHEECFFVKWPNAVLACRRFVSRSAPNFPARTLVDLLNTLETSYASRNEYPRQAVLIS